MKNILTPLLGSMLILFSSCNNNSSSKFLGRWQEVKDGSNSFTITQSGKNFIFEMHNAEYNGTRTTATYDKEKDILQFNTPLGTKIDFIYDKNSKRLLAAGKEFIKITDSGDIGEVEAPRPKEEKYVQKPISEEEMRKYEKCTSTTGLGVIITGDNVRLRSEPDLTKDNIILLLKKGTEAADMSDVEHMTEGWIKICYDGKTGWVSDDYTSIVD